MQCRIQDLRCKEVVNVCDGLRLGYVSDVLLNTATGQIVAIVVPGPCRYLGLIGREDDYIIPWECICRLGDDIVLVQISGGYKRERCRKRRWL